MDNLAKNTLELSLSVRAVGRTTSEAAAEFRKLGLGLTYAESALADRLIEEHGDTLEFLKDN
ncbi:MAG: hypothetical protein LBR80_17845 [Deltaproteobacteria bacterium]|nr:hypothetical protein [Deltaproteobacteria bacterium]